MKKLILSFVSAGAVLAFAPAFTPAYGEVIILDNFDIPAGISDIAGRTPDTKNLPGGVWSYHDAYQEYVNSNGGNGFAYLLADGEAVVPITSNPSNLPLPYVEPLVVNISAYLAPQGIMDGDNYALRGLGLGFTNVAGTNDGNGHGGDNFSGIDLTPQDTLRLIDNGVATSFVTGTVAGAAVLSYNYNTVTGAITDVFYDNFNYSSFFAGHDVAAGDTYAGWYVSDSAGNNGGLIQQFEVQTEVVPPPPPAVPEPSTWALMTLSLGSLGFFFFRHQRNRRA